jgi:hypothetical protein
MSKPPSDPQRDALCRWLPVLGEYLKRTIKEPVERDWAPLERVLPHEHCVGFMWMGWETGPDGRPIAEYKHGITRRYLHLDEDVNAYRYVPALDSYGSYVRIPLELAIEEVFEGLERMHGVNADDPRATPYDDAFRRARDDALRRAGFTVVRL